MKSELKKGFFVCLYIIALLTNLNAQDAERKLPLVDPVKEGFAPLFFEQLTKDLDDSIPCLGSFLVWHKNGMVFEKYFHGATDSTVFSVKSVTKSFVSALAGIAKSKGLLPDLNTSVVDIMPEYSAPVIYTTNTWLGKQRAYNEEIRKMVTLKHLLTMQAGFQWDEFGPIARAYVFSSDPIRFTFDLPFDDAAPGETFRYCTPAASLFCVAMSKGIKTDLKKFAESNLFVPAGMKLSAWSVDPQGRYIGGSEMYLRSQDMMRFGLLYLNNGRANGKQLIPEAWIKESTDKHVELEKWDVMPGANGYGYYWWRRLTNGHQAYVASGAGGQLICIIPELEMVVVATCLLNENNRGRSEIKRLHEFIDKITKVIK